MIMTTNNNNTTNNTIPLPSSLSLGGGSRYQCPFCNTCYKMPPRSMCDHLLCEYTTVFDDDDDDDALVSKHRKTDYAYLSATLLGRKVPRTVAVKFLMFVREKQTPKSHTHNATNYNPSDRHNYMNKYIDLLQQCPSLHVIKSSSFDWPSSPSPYIEATYYFIPDPSLMVPIFSSFVMNAYVDNDIPSSSVHCLLFLNNNQSHNISVANGVTQQNNYIEKGRWKMITGFDDGCPLFLTPSSHHHSSSSTTIIMDDDTLSTTSSRMTVSSNQHGDCIRLHTLLYLPSFCS
eukprot:TRINITY_DN277_c0_g1_i2.p1 TRINITY_DN277_c0_g1~~TRINITY_DN277_c0_g1_i2.p1  ORF type:complete len:289 (+),score=58.87 TRINITY_DN277_c0_g1_i2:74-940(+)